MGGVLRIADRDGNAQEVGHEEGMTTHVEERRHPVLQILLLSGVCVCL